MKEEEIIIRCGESIGVKKIYGLCSGGKDSMSACTKAHEIRPLDGIILVDTTIVARGNIYNKPPYIASKAFAERLGVPFICIRPRDDLKKGFHYVKNIAEYGTGKTFENYCIKYGFPHAGQHDQVFRFLKKKALVGFVMDQTKVKERIGFISGVRSKESKRRLENAQLLGIDEDTPRIIWIAPIHSWSTEKVWAYTKEKDFQLSECYKILHLSGDCLCGAYAKKGEAGLISAFYEGTAEQLKRIEKVANKIHKGSNNWGRDESMKAIKEQTKLSENFICSECEVEWE